jgi:putative DNA primase/helicase
MTPLDYAALGLAVFPCHYAVIKGTARCSCGKPNCADAAKHPYQRHAPNGFKNASTDSAKIKRWIDGPYNIGITTGRISGIVVIDVDPRHGGDESLARLEAEYGPLPLTWRALTGGGGEHVSFRYPARHIPTRTSPFARGIDIKGDGGYIIAPRSRQISGRYYEWSVDHHPESTELAAMPAWLVEKAAAPENPKIDWKGFVGEPVPEGKRHDSLTRLAGLLFYRLAREPHVAARLLIAFNATCCSPPLEDDEIKRIIEHAASREIAKRRLAQ